MLVKALAALLYLAIAAEGYAQLTWADDGEEEAVRKDMPVGLPGAPADANLMEFDAGPLTPNRFFIDGSSIAVGGDGEVRYVLVVKTAGGATNVSYEGVRCGERRFKVYFLGHDDGSWGKARASGWSLIDKQIVNQHRQTLYREVFCAQGVISDPEAGRRALLRMRPLAARAR